MGKCEVRNKVKEKVEKVEEAGISLLVCANINSPRKTEIYYNKDLRLARLLVTNVLLEYTKSGESILKPIRCLDAVGGVGAMGLLWRKYSTEEDASVSINTPYLTSFQVIKENAQHNGISVNVINKDPCLLLHEEAFNFIHLDCHTEACQYFDAVFKCLPRSGIVSITTKDDAALQGRTPEMALRNYQGVITKTSYGTELGVRLVIAAMARSAAKYSKSIKVLLCAFFKNSFLIVVKTSKGSNRAAKALENIRRLVHCSMCEERAFYPITNGFVLENPNELLSCNCASQFEGKVTMELGPVWAGEILDHEFIAAMMRHENVPSKKHVDSFLVQLLAEALCGIDHLVDAKETGEKEEADGCGEPAPRKKLKTVNSKSDICENITPPFYYNLHRHCISSQGPNLAPVDKVVQALKKSGYRASRTHFDREAVRTDATLSQLVKVIRTCTVVKDNNDVCKSEK